MHRSTRQLEADVRAFIKTQNENPGPFTWTKSAGEILAAAKRFRLRVEHNLCNVLSSEDVIPSAPLAFSPP